MGQPQNPYSPISREYAQYNIYNDEILSFDEDPLEKEGTMEKEKFQTSKNTGITPELPTKEKAKTMPTGISIIPLFRNSD
jgi:hypothetical protein